MGKYHTIQFEKDYYAIHEVVDLVAERFNITVRKDSENPKRKKTKRNDTYRAMEMYIRRYLQEEAGYEPDGKDLIEVSERKHLYSREVVDKVVNGDILAKLCKNYADSEIQKDFAEPEQRADDYRAMLEDGRVDAFFKSLQNEEGHDSTDFDYEIEKSVNKYKLDIVVDFICKYLIRVDEETLRDDLIFNHLPDLQAPTADDMLAAERLQDVGNYYQPRKEFVDLLKQAQANAEKI